MDASHMDSWAQPARVFAAEVGGGGARRRRGVSPPAVWKWEDSPAPGCCARGFRLLTGGPRLCFFERTGSSFLGLSNLETLLY